ncbi:MAG: AEC family transporter, partial [Eubacteriales bacterium]|nr:AEC family transporter [Eubacteriales bacterium]
MDLAMITFKQVFILFVLIFAGFIAVKTKIVKLEDRKIFSNLLLYLVTPMMVIHSYMIDFDPDILGNILLAFGLSAALMILGIIISFIITIRMKNDNTPIIRFAC